MSIEQKITQLIRPEIRASMDGFTASLRVVSQYGKKLFS